MTISYKVLATTWVNIRLMTAPRGNSPPNAIGKKIRESVVSPPMVEMMALQPKPLPLVATFILDIIHALTVEPAMNARREPTIDRGTSPKRELKLSAAA